MNSEPLRLNTYIFLLAAAAVCASAYLGHHLFGWMPHIPDETSYAFQGRVIAQGQFWLSPPPVSEAFHVDHIWIGKTRWASIYPPGWPLLLAVGWIIHFPGLINPLLFGLTILGIWCLASQLFDRRTAMIASICFAASPFVLLTASGFMAHMPALCFSIWSMAALQSGKKRAVIAAGFLGGFAFLIRPFTAVVFLAAPFFSRVIPKPKTVIFVAAGFAAPAIFFLCYNSFVFGGPFMSGYRYDPAWDELKFSVSYFPESFLWYIRNLSHCLWGLPFPDLLLLLPLLLPAANGKKDLLLSLSALSLVVAYSFVSWTDIVDSGPRYVFEATGVLSILVARSVERVLDRVRRNAFVLIPAACLLIYPLGVRLPNQIRYHAQNYHGQNHTFLNKVDQAGVGRSSLVFISGDPYALRSFFFGNTFPPQNGKRVFAIDLPDRESDLESAFPRAETWRVTIRWDPIPGPNPYIDRWKLREFDCRRLK